MRERRHPASMPPRERPADRGTRLARSTLLRIGDELRTARVDRGLTLSVAAAAASISMAELSRIERGLAPRVPLAVLGRCAAIVGLDLSVRCYPGGSPVRDAGHLALLADLRSRLHRSLTWATEVPLPIPGDQRAWDALVTGSGWSCGVEAETLPRDAQALVRRLLLKQRDGGAEAMILLLRQSRAVSAFLREAADELAPALPIPGPRALELLAAGIRPGGNAIVLLPRVPGQRRTAPRTSSAGSADAEPRAGSRRPP